MSGCPRIAPMLGARPGELSDEERRVVAAHLAGCEACRARAADVAALSGLVGEALTAEANRRDFSTFSDQVLERIGARRRRRRLWFAIVAPFAAATAALVLYFATGSSEQRGPLVEVSAEGRGAIVLQTRDGPVVLIGSADPEGT